jgi:hypothetical protein
MMMRKNICPASQGKSNAETKKLENLCNRKKRDLSRRVGFRNSRYAAMCEVRQQTELLPSSFGEIDIKAHGSQRNIGFVFWRILRSSNGN